MLTSSSLNEACRETWTFSGIWTVWFYDHTFRSAVCHCRTGFRVNRHLCHCVLFSINFTVSVLCGCSRVSIQTTCQVSCNKTNLQDFYHNLHNTCWLHGLFITFRIYFVEYRFCGACIFTVFIEKQYCDEWFSSVCCLVFPGYLIHPLKGTEWTERMQSGSCHVFSGKVNCSQGYREY